MQSAKRSLGLVNIFNRYLSKPLTSQTTRNTYNSFTPKLIIKNTFLYTGALTIGGVLGLATGEYFLNDETNPTFISSRIIISKPGSKYVEFPLNITLYQYHTCVYSTQIRTYLDYFGFSYNLVEVDTTSKKSLKEFTNARQLPIVVLTDTNTNEEWHLTNATAILSALESLRCYDGQRISEIISKYLPVMDGKVTNYQKNPFKYYVHNSDLNSIEMRRWVNKIAAPAFRSSATSSLFSTRELIDLYSSRSQWRKRYNNSTFKYYYVYYARLIREYLENYGKTNELDKVLAKWETDLGVKKFMNGDMCPDLADLIMYATASTFESMTFFSETVSRHENFKEWYKNMKEEVTKLKIPVLTETREVGINTEKEELPDKEEEKELKSQVDDDVGRMNLRILSINYLIHVVVFTYAAYNSFKK